MKHCAVLLFVLTSLGLYACRTVKPGDPPPPAAGPAQSESDEYTSYELLGSDSHKFRITHEVSATTAGARYYYAFVRGGVFLSEVRAEDLYTGERLDVDLVSGQVARENGHPAADPSDNYLRVYLARPVPENGETRLQIHVTYEDPKSYQFFGKRIFFGRVLGVKRISIVLPTDHDLVSINHPAQLVTQPDGRVRASLINTSTSPLSLEVVAQHRSEKRTDGAATSPANGSGSAETALASFPIALPGSWESTNGRRLATLVDRAHQDREMVWTLGDPSASSFVLQRECTETHTGSDRWIDVMRGPRHVSNPVATALDTGERLGVEILTASEAQARGLASETELSDANQVVAVSFEPLRLGATLRLRVEEDLVDPDLYNLSGDELVFASELTVARSRVVLPKGWSPTEITIPATVIETPDKRVALEFINTSPTALELSIRARNGKH